MRGNSVQINDEASEWTGVTSGIPQGSVLGPVPFVPYVNDLPNNIFSSAYLFVNDVKIFIVVNDMKDRKVPQGDLDTVSDWSNKWLFEFHPNKCIVMSVYKKSNLEYTYTYYLKDSKSNNSYTLAWQDQEKDVRITTDKDLEFEMHISQKINKANSMTSIIERTYQFLNAEKLLSLHKAMV